MLLQNPVYLSMFLANSVLFIWNRHFENWHFIYDFYKPRDNCQMFSATCGLPDRKVDYYSK